MKLNIHWTSGGLALFYMLGITRNMKAKKPNIFCPSVDHYFSGISAGSWCATIACSNLKPQDIDNCVESYLTDVSEEEFWDSILSEDISSRLNIKEFASDNLRIGLTHFPTMRREWVSHFSDTDAAIQACITSSHIPVLCGSVTHQYKENKYMDGCIGLGSREPEDTKTVLRISPDMYGRNFDRKEMFNFERQKMKDLYMLGKEDFISYGIGDIKETGLEKPNDLWSMARDFRSNIF